MKKIWKQDTSMGIDSYKGNRADEEACRELLRNIRWLGFLCVLWCFSLCSDNLLYPFHLKWCTYEDCIN